MTRQWRIWATAFAAMAMVGTVGIAHAANTRGLAAFKGNRSGVFLIAQGPETRIVGIARVRIASDRSGRRGKIRITGTLSGEDFPAQTFKLQRGRASVNVLLPGIESFAMPATGAYRMRGGRVQIEMESAAPSRRRMILTLQFQPGGETIALSGVIEVGGSTAPVYLEIVGA